jgi:hypothetical protein
MPSTCVYMKIHVRKVCTLVYKQVTDLRLTSISNHIYQLDNVTTLLYDNMLCAHQLLTICLASDEVIGSKLRFRDENPMFDLWLDLSLSAYIG